MKIIFLARDLDSSKLLAHVLLRDQLIDKVVLESGAAARKRKLIRMLTRRPWWRIVLLPFDLGTLYYMTIRANRLFASKYPSIPEPPIALRVADANDTKCLDFLKAENPDVLLIYGTAILKAPVLSIPKVGVLNIHGGMVPKYRNVHGEFWAVAHRRFEELGTSVLVADEGIDSGDIVKQRTLGLKDPVTVAEAKVLVFEETIKLVTEVMREVRGGLIKREPQRAGDALMFQTPTFVDWLRYRVPL